MLFERYIRGHSHPSHPTVMTTLSSSYNMSPDSLSTATMTSCHLIQPARISSTNMKFNPLIPVSGSLSGSNPLIPPPDIGTSATMRINDSLPSQDSRLCMLPPCVVCGDRSSGYHYGANTCEACKSFFRRCLTRKKEGLRCKQKANCVILPKSQKVCKACRYRKCIENGMSREAIKTGRYTLAKRNKNIFMVNQLEEQGKITEDGAINLQYQQQNEMDQIIDKLSEVKIFKEHTDETLETLYRSEEEYVSQQELDAIIFGSIDHLSRHDIQHIYNSTGIDVDGFYKKIQLIVPHFKPRLEEFLEFCKSLPGFQDIPIADRFALIIGSEFDRWLFLCAHWTNTEEHLFVSPENASVIFSKHDMVRLSDQLVEQCDQAWRFFERIQRLELTPLECVVVTCLGLLTNDTPISSAAQQIVSNLADKLLEMLQHIVDKNHDPEEQFMAKLMVLLMDSKSLANFHDTLRRNVKESAERILENTPVIDAFMHYLLKEEKDSSKQQVALEEMKKHLQYFSRYSKLLCLH